MLSSSSLLMTVVKKEHFVSREKTGVLKSSKRVCDVPHHSRLASIILCTGSFVGWPCRPLSLQPFAGHKDEQDAQGGSGESRHDEDNECSLDQQSADVGLADARKVEWRVFAEAEQRHDGVERVLIRGEKVDADCEW